MDKKSPLQQFGQGASKGFWAGGAGAPVDLLTLALNALIAGGGYVGHKTGALSSPPDLIEKPVGGSEWIAQKMREAGLLQDSPGTWGDALGGVAGNLAGPLAAAKAPQIARGLLQAEANAMAPATLNKQTGAIVWHGSPHKFDKFDSSKIGTGEGAQAYGHGLYLAENKGVASGYKEKLSPDVIHRIQADEYTIAGEPQFVLRLHDVNGKVTKTPYLSPDEFDKWVGPDAAKMLREKGDGDYKNLNIDFGNIYKVDLPDEHIAKMLDWDKPLFEQPTKIQEMAQLWGKTSQGTGDIFGDQFLKEAQSRFGGAAGAADALRARGIPGVRYLDGGSRGTGAGTSNYVVFPGNEDILTILERNGITP